MGDSASGKDIENIYVINLKQRTDRMHQILDAFKNTNTRIIRVDAHSHRQGWRGCAMSHLSIINYAAKNNLPYVIVVEDDTILYEDFKNKFAQIISYLKNNIETWDIYHGCLTLQGGDVQVKLIDQKNMIGTIHKNGSTTNFIIYNQSVYPMFQKLIPIYQSNPYITKNQYSIDMIIIKSNLRRLFSVPFLAYQSNGFSDIEQRHIDYRNWISHTENTLNNKLLSFVPKSVNPPLRFSYHLVHKNNKSFIIKRLTK